MSSDPKQDLHPVPPVGAPCWIEIIASDPPKLRDFYAALFPAWKFKPAEADTPTEVIQYTFEQPSGLSGGIVKLPASCPKPSAQPMGIGSTVYHFVNSIDEIETKIIELGGKKVLDKTPEKDHGWFANFIDPEGNRFGVFEANWGQS